MTKIRQLSPEIISKIAAGEVIERPVYAVKELLENALDAQATMIKILIEDSGLQKIMVTDNGTGMSAADLKLSVLPHTTSKISSLDDLYAVQSLGFRGEALSSIAAISKLSIQSKQKQDSVGTKIEIVENKIISVQPIGMPNGTTVLVEDLFYSLPARHKFLKAKQSEFRFITQLVSQYAIAYPQVRFLLQHNGKTVTDILAAENLEERVSIIVGDSVMPYFIPVKYQNGAYSIHGYIAKPQLSTTSRTRQTFFVNNRGIQNQSLAHSIRRAYGTLLEPTTLPVFILFIEVPAEHLDVNIHPRKEEVAFHQEEQIIAFIEEGIRETLEKNNLTYVDKRWAKSTEGETEENFSVREGTTETYAATVLKKEFIKDSQEILQIHNLYLVVQVTRGVYFIDQHAAHERILYEQFSASLKQKIKEGKNYLLPRPHQLNLSLNQAELIREHHSILEKLGFIFEEKKEHTYSVKSVPALFKDKNITEFISSLLDDLEEFGSTQSIDMRTHRMLTFLACRSAIKAGQSLTQKEMKDLLKKLLTVDNRYTCPHGRPTMYEIPLAQLHTFFKRI